jgi:tRNA nucleotidyltransferase (CCA-adding enzyme)
LNSPNAVAPARLGSGGAVLAAKEPVPARWEHYDHGADIGVRGLGPTKAAAFEQAAMALTAVIAEPETVQERETVHISCEAGDDDLLLAAWLNAIVSQMAVRRMLFRRFHVELQPGRLTGLATGERISPERHQPAVEVKGATYTSLRVARTSNGGWLAQTVVDV